MDRRGFPGPYDFISDGHTEGLFGEILAYPESVRTGALGTRSLKPREGSVIRVFLACDDEAYCTEICRELQDQHDSVVFAQKKYEFSAVRDAVEFVPDVVIFVAFERDEPEITGAVKESLPHVPLFLVTERFSLEMEKDALSCGIEAVFQKEHDFVPLITNIRAMKDSAF